MGPSGSVAGWMVCVIVDMVVTPQARSYFSIDMSRSGNSPIRAGRLLRDLRNRRHIAAGSLDGHAAISGEAPAVN